jgi:hypothetical protein
LQTVRQYSIWHARGVDFAATDLKPLAVEQKIIRADGEGVG